MLKFKTRFFAFDVLFFGIFLHFVGNLFVNLWDMQLGGALIAITGLICSLGSFLFAMQHKVFPFEGKLKQLNIIMLLLFLIMIIRGYLISYNYQWISIPGLLNFHLVSPLYILPYFIPLIMLMGTARMNFVFLSGVNKIVLVLFLALALYYFNRISADSLKLFLGLEDRLEKSYSSIIGGLYIPFGFFLLLFRYLPRKIWYLNLIAWFMYCLIMIIGARRGGLLSGLLLGLFTILLYLNSLKGQRKLLAQTSVIFGIISIVSVYFLLQNTIFGYITERGFEDTRSKVDNALLSQMNTLQLIFGKGLNGRYYHPLYQDDYMEGWRYGTETGFFNLVLKGGFLLAVIYVIVLLIPALKGIFRSNNHLTKAGGYYILISLIELYPFGWLAFNIKFLIIWMMALISYSPVFRKMNDEEIYYRFFVKHPKPNQIK